MHHFAIPQGFVCRHSSNDGEGSAKKEGAKDLVMHWLKLNQVLQLFKGVCNNMEAWLISSDHDTI